MCAASAPARAGSGTCSIKAAASSPTSGVTSSTGSPARSAPLGGLRTPGQCLVEHHLGHVDLEGRAALAPPRVRKLLAGGHDKVAARMGRPGAGAGLPPGKGG